MVNGWMELGLRMGAHDLGEGVLEYILEYVVYGCRSIDRLERI